MFTYKAVSLGGGVWMIKRFDEDGKMTERLITVPVDWYEQQVIQKAIAEGSWA